MEKTTRFESIALIVLTLMLASVFVLSVNMYEDVAANVEEGALAVVANAVRDYLNESDAVAAFFGFDGVKEEANVTDIPSEAAAYIERYNQIYAGIN